MTRTLSFDLCVIGAGTAGLTAASLAAQFGARTVLVESGRMGGECLNTGCVPSKSLLAAARAAHAARSSGGFGIESQPRVHFDRVHAHVQRVIAEIAPHDSAERFERMGVKVIREAAHFVGAREIVAGDTRIHARRVLVATGSKPSMPPIEGLDAVPHFTNEDVFDNAQLPSHLAVLGGGALGLEIAQAHRRLGAKVTVIEASDAMEKDEPELAARLVRSLAAEGIAIRTHAKVRKAGAGNGSGGVVLDIDEGGQQSRLEVSHLLVAAGRQARIEGLGLDAAGIDHDAHGIRVDQHLRTSARGVYAAGDVVAHAPHFTHIAAYHAGIVIRNALFRLPARVDYRSLPWVTYTDPELARAGMSEADARKAHEDDVAVSCFEFADNDRSHAERDTEGVLKIVARKNGHILGASILGAHAGELIHLWVLAIDRGLKVRDVARMIAPYPTLGEAGKSAATALLKPKLVNGLSRGVVRALSWLP